MEDVGRDLDFLGLDTPIDVGPFCLHDVSGGNEGGDHLSGDVDLERGGGFCEGVCGDVDVDTLLVVEGDCAVVYRCLEGLYDGLPARGAGVEEVETEDGHHEELGRDDCLVHGWAGVLDEQSHHRHEVVVAVVNDLYLHRSNSAHELRLALDLFCNALL